MANGFIGVSRFSAKDDRCRREGIMLAFVGLKQAAGRRLVMSNPPIAVAALSILLIVASSVPLSAQAAAPELPSPSPVNAPVLEDAVILSNKVLPDGEAPQTSSQPELPGQPGPFEQGANELRAPKLSVWEDSREALAGFEPTPEWAKPGNLLGSLGTVIASEATKEWIAPGAVLLHLALLTTTGWHKVHIVAVDLASGLHLDALLPQQGITKRSSVSRLVASSGVLAGINADFYDISGSGAPLGFLADNGKVVSSPREDGIWASIGLARDGIKLLDALGFAAEISAPGGESFPISGFNKPHPKGNAVTLYDQHWGPTTPAAPAGLEAPGPSADQLAPPGPPAMPGMVEMEIQDGTVKAIHIPGGGTGLAPGVLVARATGKGAEFVLRHFQAGSPVGVSVGLATDISAYDAVISGKPLLVRDGAKCQGLSEHRGISGHLPAPRTVIGSKGGRAFLIVIDGRAPGVRGMTLEQAADLALAMGLDVALNLDGGGSTSMAVRRDEVQGVSVVNYLSDGSQRALPYAVGVVSEGEPDGIPARLRMEIVPSRGILAPPWIRQTQDPAGQAVVSGVLPVSSIVDVNSVIRPGSDRPWQDPASMPEISLVQGDSVLIEVKALDLFGNLVDMPQAAVAFAVRDEAFPARPVGVGFDGGAGSSRVLEVYGGGTLGGVITALAPGTAIVTATLPTLEGPISAGMRVRVIGPAASLAVVTTDPSPRPGMPGAGFRVFAIDGSGYSAEVPQDMVRWEVRDMGNTRQLVAEFQGVEVVAGETEEQHEPQPTTADVADEGHGGNGDACPAGVVKQGHREQPFAADAAEGGRGEQPSAGEVVIDSMADPASWSLTTYPEEVTASVSFGSVSTAPPESAAPVQAIVPALDAVSIQGAAVRYRFEGTEKTRAAYLIRKSPLPVAGEPLALGIWVHGDGKGPWVRAKVVDSTGRSFPVDFPRADWYGWKYVQADLPPQAAYPVYVERVYAVEFDKARQYSGTVAFAGLTAVYGPQRPAPSGMQSPGPIPSPQPLSVEPVPPAEMTIALHENAEDGAQDALVTAVLDLRQDMTAAARAEAWKGFISLLEAALGSSFPAAAPPRPVVIVTGADLFGSAPDLELFSRITQRLASLGFPVVVVHGAVWTDEVVSWNGVTFVSYPTTAKGAGGGILLDVAKNPAAPAGLCVRAARLSAPEGSGEPGYHLLFAGDHAGKVE